jgi:short-subunit dehydrogenase
MFANKVIILTGASDGIGAELARQLANQKAILVLAARSAPGLEKVAAQCQALGAQTLCVPTDVSIQTQCAQLIEKSLNAFGRIDALVNNAGISMHANFDAISDLSTFETLMRVNFFGSLWCTHYALESLKATQGIVVAVSSLAGKTGVPGRTTYCASKFAQTGFFEALRIEAAEYGVSVMTAFPGVVDTEIRRHGLNSAGQTAGVSGLREDGAMSVQECAALIAAGMAARKREVIMTTKGKFGLMLKPFAPGLIDNMARAALKK